MFLHNENQIFTVFPFFICLVYSFYAPSHAIRFFGTIPK